MKKIWFVLAVCCLLISCETPDNSGNDDNNSSSGRIRAPNVSKGSGLYSQPFSVELTASEGNSIYYSIDGSMPEPDKVNNKTIFKYSSAINVTDRNNPIQTNLLATSENSTNFYGRLDDPRGDMPAIYIPANNQVPKATVIRAMAADSSGTRTSDVVTRTYFIGGNLADYANHPIISLVTDPYNLVDINSGIMVRGVSTNRWDKKDSPTGTQYNFMQRGEDWERVASMELFAGNTGSRSVPVASNVGIRIRGGWSRAAGQKSFNIYFRGEYGGLNNLTNYQLIPGAVRANGTPVGTYKSFMLRNGANDSEYTKFYDVFLQDLLRNRSFTTQAGVPCIVYINGEYWGPYNLQERYSDNHTEYKYGVNRNNVISYDNGAIDDGSLSDESYYRNIISFKDKNMSNAQNYNDFCNLFDIQNFIDYFAAQIYIHNEDWPQNNYRLWRTRTVESGNPYGDTKWRWQMFDVEFAMGIYSRGSTPDPFQKRIINNDHDNAKLFAALMKNSDFKRDFVNTMMDLHNVDFHPDVFESKLNEYAAIYKPLMGDTVKGYFARWGGWPDQFNNKVNDARMYLRNIRSAMTGIYLPQHFGVSGLTNVTFAAKHDNNIMNTLPMKINTVTPIASGGTWTGQYYQNNPITVTTNDVSGYSFVNWSVTGGAITSGNGSKIITVTLNSSNAQITANYSANITVVPITSISINKNSLSLSAGKSEKLTASVLPLDATYKTVMWSSSNNNVATADQNGNIRAVAAGTAVITAAAGSESITCTVTVTAPQPLNWTTGYYTSDSGAMTYENIGNNEYKINITTAGTENWHATMRFSYEAEATAGIRYTYSFYARTDSGTRNNMNIQYYWTDQHGSRSHGISLNDTYQHFSFTGDALPTKSGANLEFQGGKQAGIYYVKDVVILPVD
ncbi:MAG: CotH kinase family protein [Treponema sp.]|nr:CotH kinase family protein [Treponema sp.]